MTEEANITLTPILAATSKPSSLDIITGLTETAAKNVISMLHKLPDANGAYLFSEIRVSRTSHGTKAA